MKVVFQEVLVETVTTALRQLIYTSGAQGTRRPREVVHSFDLSMKIFGEDHDLNVMRTLVGDIVVERTNFLRSLILGSPLVYTVLNIVIVYHLSSLLRVSDS